MNLNDVLRRVRFIFDFNDNRMIEVFASADTKVSREQVCAWLKAEDAEGYLPIEDREMALFLNGLINEFRGRRDGPQPEPEDSLSNNMVLIKLRIAMNMQSDDVQALLEETGLKFSKHELSALFRKPGHKHYRNCEDQLLRNFLKGLQQRQHAGLAKQSAPETVTPDSSSPVTPNPWER